MPVSQGQSLNRELGHVGRRPRQVVPPLWDSVSPMPFKGFGRDREGLRLQDPPAQPDSCPASPLKRVAARAKPPPPTVTVPATPPLGRSGGHLQPGGTPSPPISAAGTPSLSPSWPRCPSGRPAESHVTAHH